jgi:hypothetical protein
MGDSIFFDRVLQSPDDTLLADNIVKGGRTPLPGKNQVGHENLMRKWDGQATLHHTDDDAAAAPFRA